MKKIYLLALVLSAIMLTVSCGGDELQADVADNYTAPGDLDTPSAPVEGESAVERIPPNVPDRDFEGYEFVIFGNSTEWNHHYQNRKGQV